MPRPPLDGIRVVDLTRILAGPFATMTLADLGADVIKVERPGTGDETRHWGPPFHEGVATYFLSVNRNKRGMALDLKHGRGKEILWRLLESADVLVSNFRPGVMVRLGLGHETVARRCPDLVYALLNGYGEDGPFAGRAAFDLVIQAESGLMDLTGWPSGPATKVGVSIADEVAGMLLVQGILTALLARHRDGRGQKVEIALHDAVLSAFTHQAQGYLTTGSKPRRLGNSHPSLVPYRPFTAADGEIVVGVASEQQWVRFCGALGLRELASDPRFASNAGRVVHREAVERVLSDHLATGSVEHWLVRLREASVPSGRVRTVAEALDGPEAEARKLIVTGPGMNYPMVGQPIRLDGATCPVRLAPPTLGEHTREVLLELGYDEGQVDRIAASGAV